MQIRPRTVQNELLVRCAWKARAARAHARTHFLRMLKSVFSFELSSVPLSDSEVDTIGAASVEGGEEAVDEAVDSRFPADGPEDEEAMVKYRVDRLWVACREGKCWPSRWPTAIDRNLV